MGNTQNVLCSSFIIDQCNMCCTILCFIEKQHSEAGKQGFTFIVIAKESLSPDYHSDQFGSLHGQFF